MPCEDDRIRFDEEKIAVTMINEPIAVSEMFLPDDGIIFFAPNTALGQKGRWQCERKTIPEGRYDYLDNLINGFKNNDCIRSMAFARSSHSIFSHLSDEEEQFSSSIDRRLT